MEILGDEAVYSDSRISETILPRDRDAHSDELQDEVGRDIQQVRVSRKGSVDLPGKCEIILNRWSTGFILSSGGFFARIHIGVFLSD